MNLGEEEAKRLGYTNLHHHSGDKTMYCYLNEDGVNLQIMQKSYNPKGKLTARIVALYGMTEIKSPEISFPHEKFELFENEIYTCLPDPGRGGRISITSKWFDRIMARNIKSAALIKFVKEIIFGKEI